MTPTTARIDAHTPEGERVTIHVAARHGHPARAAVWRVWVESGVMDDGEDEHVHGSFAEAMADAARVAELVLAGA